MTKTQNSVIYLKDYRSNKVIDKLNLQAKKEYQDRKIFKDAGLLLALLTVGIGSLLVFTGQFHHLVATQPFLLN
jgi:hypothetical protein